MGFFRQAIDLDPTYALAYVGLAECFVVLRVHSWPVAPDALVSAKAAAAKALDIDDTIAEAHATLGAIRMTAEHDWLAPSSRFAVPSNWRLITPRRATGMPISSPRSRGSMTQSAKRRRRWRSIR